MWKKKVAASAHNIMSLTRPKSFPSPILLGLSEMLHKKYASRELIDALSFLGFCSSYEETLKFEASIMNDPENHTCSENAFVQYSFDNTYHKTCTIDGKNTFHAMGGIKIVTPASYVTSKNVISRLKKIRDLNPEELFADLDEWEEEPEDSNNININETIEVEQISESNSCNGHHPKW